MPIVLGCLVNEVIQIGDEFSTGEIRPGDDKREQVGLLLGDSISACSSRVHDLVTKNDGIANSLQCHRMAVDIRQAVEVRGAAQCDQQVGGLDRVAVLAISCAMNRDNTLVHQINGLDLSFLQDHNSERLCGSGS